MGPSLSACSRLPEMSVADRDGYAASPLICAFIGISGFGSTLFFSDAWDQVTRRIAHPVTRFARSTSVTEATDALKFRWLGFDTSTQMLTGRPVACLAEAISQ